MGQKPMPSISSVFSEMQREEPRSNYAAYPQRNTTQTTELLHCLKFMDLPENTLLEPTQSVGSTTFQSLDFTHIRSDSSKSID